MDVGNEKVFIVWGGNQQLAKSVGTKLKKYNYNGIAGGGYITDMYLGAQIFSQIRKCTQAIILVQQEAYENGKFNFNDNLMFEWGYLTARMQPNKMHVFLIDIQTRNLPSDLMGTWAVEVKTTGRSDDDIAEEIARIFYANASKPLEIDKMNIIHTWEQTKNLIVHYNDAPTHSDIQMAHIVLHSAFVGDHFMEYEYAEQILNKVNPISDLLATAIQLFKTQIAIYRESDSMSKYINFDFFAETKTILERPINFASKDENLDLWMRFFSLLQLMWLYYLIEMNPEISEKEKATFAEKAIKLGEKCIEISDEILSIFPKELHYANQYIGSIHRYFYQLHKKLGRMDEAISAIKRAADARKDFYLTYKSLYPGDIYLEKHFAQLYYLYLARGVDYYDDDEEKLIIRRTISSFLSKIQKQHGRQHAALERLREKATEILD